MRLLPKPLTALALVFGIGVMSCQPGNGKPDVITGKWKLVAYDRGALWNETMEYFSDGTYRSVADYGVHAGKWRLVDDTHIALESPQGNAVNDFMVDDNRLTLIDAKGAKYTYERVAAGAEAPYSR